MKFTPLLFAVLLLSGCAGSSYTIKTGTQALTESNIARIQNGMTQAEVLNILGTPSTKISNGVIGEIWSYSMANQTVHSPGFFEIFKSPTTDIKSIGVSVNFDNAGRVKDVTNIVTNPVQPVTVKFN